MKRKIALITGITGQDGSYLAEFLLKKNYKDYVKHLRIQEPQIAFKNTSNLYFNKLKPSTWLTEFINFNGSNNKFEIIYNSKMLSKNILKYREIYNFLLLSEYDEVTKLNNNEIKELY